MSNRLFNEYRKKVKLKNDKTVTFHLLEKGDKEKLHKFFCGLPIEDRLYLRHDVSDISVVESWVNNIDYEKVIPIIAEIDDRIIGDGTLHMAPHSWSRHVGEIRIVVDCDFRRKGLGMLLAKEIFFLALNVQLEKIIAEMAENQTGAVKVFESLGFKREANLKDHIIDLEGQKSNLIIMSNHVSSLWDIMQDHIMDSFKDLSGK